MPASEAQIRANQANARKSKGPTSPEGKQASAQNSLKHGLTSRKLLPEAEAEEVDRRYAAFCQELRPAGDVGAALVHQAAVLSVRAERCVRHENAVLTDRVRKAEAEFVAPEGVDEDTAARLRAEAGKLALFDDSKAATLARKYEAAARSGFLRALKELRTLAKAAEAALEAKVDEQMASFLRPKAKAEEPNLRGMSRSELEALYAERCAKAGISPAERARSVGLVGIAERFEAPFAVGKPG